MGSGTTLAEITRLDMIKVAIASLTSPRYELREFPSVDSELHLAYEGQSRGSENPSHLN